MEDTYTMDEAAVIRDVAERVGRLTDDEVALVRTLTPADLAETARAEHLKDLVDLLTTVRDDEAMAEYVYAIAPDGTARSRRSSSGVGSPRPSHASSSRAAAPSRSAASHRGGATVRRSRMRRVPAPVG